MPSLYEIVLDVSTHLGFSVIPLTGKRPPQGFDFKKYQTQCATVDNLQTWFGAGEFVAYGVVCGSVSGGLLVLDFDSASAYQTFALLFPALALSYTVKTRRGYHVYFRSKQPLRSQKVPGGELLAQGSLVVGAGSCISDVCYSIAVNTSILDLSKDDLSSLLAWAAHKDSDERSANAFHTPASAAKSHNPISHLINLYNTYAPMLGRNNALYRAAASAARAGINQADTVGSLALLHASTPATRPHPPESTPQRISEAAATIASAYKASHKARKPKSTETIRLPNTLREYLLKIQKSTITARLLDIFALAGWEPGHLFSTSDIVMLASSYGLGRSSVLAALSGALSQINNERIIPKHSHSHNHNKSPVGDCDNGRFNSRGRKANIYVVPDLASLCRVCGIAPEQMGSTDPLNAEDLASEKAYRMALHRELVKRASPELSYRWHGSRLSISARTVRRYNAALGVIVTPIFGYVPLSWANVERLELWGIAQRSISGRIITPGRWLQTAEGKRYPALKGIACTLLKAHHQLIACKRMPSKFQLPVADQPIVLHPCLWRRLDAAAPDWGGGEYDNPMGQGRITYVRTHESRTHDEGICADERLIAFVNGYMARPQDLTVLKGVGAWYQTILNEAGITRYEQLAHADAVRIARLSGLGPYVTPRQVSFWIDQARVLAAHLVSDEELQGWSYKDWCQYDFERGRIESSSSTLRQALAREFREKRWLKYHGQLPEWFIEMVNT